MPHGIRGYDAEVLSIVASAESNYGLAVWTDIHDLLFEQADPLYLLDHILKVEDLFAVWAFSHSQSSCLPVIKDIYDNPYFLLTLILWMSNEMQCFSMSSI